MTTVEELKERRKKWIDALRSGEYKQAQEALKTDKKTMCCLGVACDVSGLAEWEIKDIEHADSIIPMHAYMNNTDYLPEKVRKYYGLKTADGNFKINGNCISLAELNDNANRSFNYIANIIEKAPEGLFIDDK